MRNRSIRGLYVLAASVAVSSALGLAGATAASASDARQAARDHGV